MGFVPCSQDPSSCKIRSGAWLLVELLLLFLLEGTMGCHCYQEAAGGGGRRETKAKVKKGASSPEPPSGLWHRGLGLVPRVTSLRPVALRASSTISPLVPAALPPRTPLPQACAPPVPAPRCVPAHHGHGHGHGHAVEFPIFS